MNKCIYKSIYFLLLTILISCQNSSKQETFDYNQTIKSNPYIQSFTTGTISRFSPIIINFNVDVPASFQNEKELQKLFVMKPEVKGELRIEDNSKLIFKPSEPLERDKIYDIDLNVGKIFKGAENLNYKIKTLKSGMRIDDVKLRISDKGDYFFAGTINTADIEDAVTVKSLISTNSIGTLKLQDNNKEGATFSFKIEDIKPEDGGKSVHIKTASNKLKYQEEDLANLEIPSKDVFDIYSIDTDSNGKYIGVTFNKNLSSNQDISGLYNVKDYPESTYTIDRNTLNIWLKDDPDSEIRSTTLRIYDGIKSIDGESLSKERSKNDSLFYSNISFERGMPYLSFLSTGNIMPGAGGTNVLFEAQALKGVIVRIIKIYTHNTKYFLQNNNLSGENNLAQVGELVARKVLFFEDMGQYDLMKKNVFGINVADFIEVDKGAIYNVRLSYNYDLSAYPVNERSQLSKEEMIAQAEIEEIEEKEELSTREYYFFSDNNNPDWVWKNRNDPAKTLYYNFRYVSKNILASDIGLIAKRGNESDNITFITNNLNTSAIMPGVAVHVFDYKNKELGWGTTDKDGFVTIKLDKGVPLYAIAKKDNDKAYLKLKKGDALSVSDFDVEGDVIQKGIKGFIYTDRGVWRPGDSIFVNFILNDNDVKLPASHPVKLELYNPRNIVTSRKVITKGVNGFYSFALKTDVNDPTGVWHCRISVGGATFSKRLRIETIKPNRLSIDISFNENILIEGTPIVADLHAAWLTGAKANKLNFDIKVNFKSIKTTFKDYKEYCFDNVLKNFEATDVIFDKGETNAEGDAKIRKTLKVGEGAPGMLRAEFITKVYEDAGSFSVVADQKQYSPYTSYVGINTYQKDDKPLITRKNHTLSIVTVTPQGDPDKYIDCEVTVFKGEWYWWWDRYSSRIADFLSSSYNTPVSKTDLRTDSKGKASFNINIPDSEWGTYVIVVKNKKSGQQSVAKTYFDSESYIRNINEKASNKATRLAITTDKEEYKVGETVNLNFPSLAGAHALITIENGTEILKKKVIKCSDEVTNYSFKADKNYMPNVYIGVTLVNPYDNTTDLPIRLYGIAPISITDPRTKLEPVIDAPTDVQPSSRFNITVSEKNKQDMTFTLALVDCGLLDLTRFQTPNPWAAFNAKEALGINTWDIYDMVVGAYGGKIERIFSIGGDDEIDNSATSGMNRFKPVVMFKGPFSLKGGATKKIEIEMPQYIGKLRCMVIAGDNKDNAYGNNAKDITVKQSVMIMGTMPRQLNPGDEFRLPVTVFTMEDNIGQIDVTLKGSALLGLEKPITKKINLNHKGSEIVWFDLKVKDEIGDAFVSVSATAGKEKAEWDADISVISNLIPIRKTETITIEPGKTGNLSVSPFGIPGSNIGTIELSAVKPLDLDKRMDYLFSYPYECIEQTISRAFPLLYIGKFMNSTKEEKQKRDQQIKNTINLLPKYMIPGGAFAYWQGHTSASAWGSIYALHFMIEAKLKGFKVPDEMFRESHKYEAMIAKGWSGEIGENSETLTQAYRLYVLALAQTPERGAMNRMREAKFGYSTQSLLAATYSVIGREDIAKKILLANINYSTDKDSYFYTLGDDDRSRALRLIALTSVGNPNNGRILMEEISSMLISEKEMNTQSTAFSLIAVSGFYEKYKPSYGIKASITGSLNVDTEIKEVFYSYPLDMKEKQNLNIENKSDGYLYAIINATGIPSAEDQFASSSEIEVSVSYSSENGEPIDISHLKMGTNFKSVVIVTNNSVKPVGNIMVSQTIPSGWEILNTRFMTDSSESVSAGVTYQDIRDCRIDSYIPFLPPNARIHIPVKLCASYAGRYFLPSTFAEDMYNPTIRSNTAGIKVSVVTE